MSCDPLPRENPPQCSSCQRVAAAWRRTDDGIEAADYCWPCLLRSLTKETTP